MPGATGELLLEWARRADAGPFSSVGVLDRVVYDSYEPFAALAGAAGVTSRVRLATMIAIGPLRSTAMLAKQAASVHGLSGGRLTLGLAVGARTEDFDAAGVEHKGRGKRLGEQLAYIRGDVDADRVGPSRDGIEILVGGLAGRPTRGWRASGRLRAQRRAASGVRQRRRARACCVERPRPPGQAEPLGAGLLRLRGHGAGRRVPPGLLRVHGPVRREDRGRQPDQRPGPEGLRARLRRGRLRRVRPLPDGRGHR